MSLSDNQRRILVDINRNGAAHGKTISDRVGLSCAVCMRTLDSLFRRGYVHIGAFEHWRLSHKGAGVIGGYRRAEKIRERKRHEDARRRNYKSTRYVVTTIRGWKIGGSCSNGGGEAPIVAQVLDSEYGYRLMSEFTGRAAVQRAQRRADELNQEEGDWEFDNLIAESEAA